MVSCPSCPRPRHPCSHLPTAPLTPHNTLSPPQTTPRSWQDALSHPRNTATAPSSPPVLHAGSLGAMRTVPPAVACAPLPQKHDPPLWAPPSKSRQRASGTAMARSGSEPPGALQEAAAPVPGTTRGSGGAGFARCSFLRGSRGGEQGSFLPFSHPRFRWRGGRGKGKGRDVSGAVRTQHGTRSMGSRGFYRHQVPGVNTEGRRLGSPGRGKAPGAAGRAAMRPALGWSRWGTAELNAAGGQRPGAGAYGSGWDRPPERKAPCPANPSVCPAAPVQDFRDDRSLRSPGPRSLLGPGAMLSAGPLG